MLRLLFAREVLSRVGGRVLLFAEFLDRVRPETPGRRIALATSGVAKAISSFVRSCSCGPGPVLVAGPQLSVRESELVERFDPIAQRLGGARIELRGMAENVEVFSILDRDMRVAKAAQAVADRPDAALQRLRKILRRTRQKLVDLSRREFPPKSANPFA